ncbi:hypothetical protein [Pedobacter metabolipauper]|uniref:T9SS C-terminal target domain-containing protein n=1 Tax=Pedobacter metabolipauper TaxID=425513 RepID=A0A4R6SSD2_9SPHI|nr:hypothetical protein [Pedobacter metabolipauper]TDQ07481.1 hypothetical protein ATK78_3607 [Pedobacter metabolipauper]
MLNKAISLIGSSVNNYVVEPLKKSNVKSTAIIAIALVSLSLSSCKKDFSGGDAFGNRSTAAADYAASSLPVVSVPAGNITTSVHWTAGNVYELSGVVVVTGGGHLEIDPGTFIKSSVNTPGSANGVLVIAKDGTIDAVGDECNPIVFTSRRLLDGNNSTVGAPGDFGGIIILGDAPINTPTGSANIEGLDATDARFTYGGVDDTDNRGNFQNVRIEYAGYQLAANIEVNGLTLGGVGSGTTVNNVETAWGLDDGFEFFGGTVSTSDLLAYANDDDQFDFDLGYTGTLSNSAAIANNASTHSGLPGTADSNGAEIDNSVANPCGTTLTTTVTFENVSIWGTSAAASAGLYENGIHVRRGATLIVSGSTVTGYNRGVFVEASAGACEAGLVGDSRIHGFVTPGNYTDLGGNTTSVTDPASWFPASFSRCWAKFDY